MLEGLVCRWRAHGERGVSAVQCVGYLLVADACERATRYTYDAAVVWK